MGDKLQSYDQSWAKAKKGPIVGGNHRVLWFLNPKTGKAIHEIKTASHVRQPMYSDKKSV